MSNFGKVSSIAGVAFVPVGVRATYNSRKDLVCGKNDLVSLNETEYGVCQRDCRKGLANSFCNIKHDHENWSVLKWNTSTSSWFRVKWNKSSKSWENLEKKQIDLKKIEYGHRFDIYPHGEKVEVTFSWARLQKHGQDTECTFRDIQYPTVLHDHNCNDIEDPESTQAKEDASMHNDNDNVTDEEATTTSDDKTPTAPEPATEGSQKSSWCSGSAWRAWVPFYCWKLF